MNQNKQLDWFKQTCPSCAKMHTWATYDGCFIGDADNATNEVLTVVSNGKSDVEVFVNFCTCGAIVGMFTTFGERGQLYVPSTETTQL